MSSNAIRHIALFVIFIALAPSVSLAQSGAAPPQPIFVENFAYDPAEPSALLQKWLISGRLDPGVRALRIGVVADPLGKAVGRVTVQEGDALDDATEAMRLARRHVCDSNGSRAAEMGGEPRGRRA